MSASEDLPYRPCVGIMLLNKQGLVFLGRRNQQQGIEYDGTTYEWQMPQGGIDEGEAPLAAAHRELKEETGVSHTSFLAEAPEWYHYDLPQPTLGRALRGRYRGQRQKWFAFRFEGKDSDIDVLNTHGSKPEFISWRWEHIENLPKLIIPFKRPVYEQVIAAFLPLTKVAR